MFFFDFLIFCVLHLCFQTVEAAPKLDSEKSGVCNGIYSVFKGCACRRGGDHIHMYISIYMRPLSLKVEDPRSLPQLWQVKVRAARCGSELLGLRFEGGLKDLGR